MTRGGEGQEEGPDVGRAGGPGGAMAAHVAGTQRARGTTEEWTRRVVRASEHLVVSQGFTLREESNLLTLTTLSAGWNMDS